MSISDGRVVDLTSPDRAAEVREWRKRMDWSYKRANKVTHVRYRTWKRYESGASDPPLCFLLLLWYIEVCGAPRTAVERMRPYIKEELRRLAYGEMDDD